MLPCAARPEQGEPLVEQGSGLLQAVELDTPGREFDREGHAVELAADVAHEGGVGVAPASRRAPLPSRAR